MAAIRALNPTSLTAAPQMINHWRWIIALGISLFVLTIEALEHQDIDGHFVREVLVYGVGISAVIWLLLTALARYIARHASVSNDLEQQRRFTLQLAHWQDHAELVKFIVRFPSNSMPVKEVVLYQYDHLAAQLSFVAEWNASAQTDPSAQRSPVPISAQYVSTVSRTPGLHDAAACLLITQPNEGKGSKSYCLPLVYDSMLIGLLRLQCAPRQALSRAQVTFLNSVSSQVALALALSMAFPRQLTQAQLTERRRMAYELHDSLAQQIGFLHLSLDRLTDDERVVRADGLLPEVEYLREVADNAYLQVRDNLNLLRQYDSIELTEMIDSCVRSIRSRTPLAINLTVTGAARPLELITSQRVFSLIQESLNNVVKHAQAHVVQIRLAWQPDRLDIAVMDDGVGFDTASVPQSGSYGLAMLREHVQALHGEMCIASEPGAGTQMQFAIPMPSQ